jgi:hypothetical protein
MFDQDEEDARYEQQAPTDYKLEAYDDPCPKCGVPTYGGDCVCYEEEDQ